METAFIDRVFRRLKGRTPATLREDFCGTGILAYAWAAKRATNRSVGLDIDPDPLDWGRGYAGKTHPASVLDRVQLRRCDVLHPPREKFDVVCAYNFSYWTFTARARLLAYFRAARASLTRDGIFLCDFMGGSEVHAESTDRTRMARPPGYATGYTYVWKHETFDPISGEQSCSINFEFRDGSRMKRAFTYHWRVWTIPELRDVLADAGFSRSRIYWEGDDGKGGGNGVFREAARGTADRTYIGYILAEP